MPQQFEQAMYRSAAYNAFALAFGAPDEDTLQSIGSETGTRYLCETLGWLGVTVDFDVPRAESLEALEVRYAQLFGHTTRGEVSPYETEYGVQGVLQQPHLLSDLGGFFAAFGLVMEADGHERADHVRCQTEFMAFLARKEAYAAERGDQEMLEITQGAQRSFLRDHLGRFGPAFGAQLDRADGQLYGALGRAFRRFVEHECERVDVAAGSDELALRMVDDEVPAACGAGSCWEGCPS